MKKISLLALLMLAFSVVGWAGNTWSLLGVEYSVDTLFHAKIGPGTSQTSLYFTNGTTDMRVFYTTIDMTNPYLTLHTVSGNDKTAGGETVSSMAQRKDGPGHRYFAGINGDFFYTSGTTAHGVSMVGTPIGTCIGEGVVYRLNNEEYKYVFDENRNSYINAVSFSGSVTHNGITVTAGGVNTDASNNVITFYNDRYYGYTNQTSACCEVQAMLVEGNTFNFLEPFKMVITGAPSTAGDMEVPTGGYVLHGQGSTADFITGLQEGDEVTVTMNAVAGGTKIDPCEVVSGQPWMLHDGETINDGNPDMHPRTCIGFANGGQTVIFLVVDGRSMISDGCRTSHLGDLLRYAGATEGMNLDGGGSTTLYTSALGVRNVPSDGSERADCNGLFLVSSAPDDNEIAEIRFKDWVQRVPKYGLYTPVIYGYNQFGMLIDTDVQGFTLEVPESLGTIKDGITFFGTGTGDGEITAIYNGLSATLPISIVGSADDLTLTNDSIITDTYRTHVVGVESQVGETFMPLDPAALSWSSSDESIVTIDADNGVLQGVRDGEAIVTGVLGDKELSMKVTVQKPVKRVYPIDSEMDLSTWNVSMSGGKNYTVEPLDNGVKVNYTGSSARVNYYRMAKEIVLWSLPDTLRVRINPGEAPVTGITFALRPNGGKISFPAVTPDSVPANVESTIDLPIDQWIDASDISNYPIQLTYIQVSLGKSAVGQHYTMLIPGLEVIYRNAPVSTAIFGDVNCDGTVTASDITELYNYLLNGDITYIDTADVNGDGAVTSADITTVYDILLGE
ncbi:MAG: phosphodiester glycosidase family protein [Muribaculaceae bacterium]|nr:phosphodiester glycosidase family protein [Muribaculaceae bacterium]